MQEPRENRLNRGLPDWLTDKEKEKVIEETREKIAQLERKFYDNRIKKTTEERREMRNALWELRRFNCETEALKKAYKKREAAFKKKKARKEKANKNKGE